MKIKATEKNPEGKTHPRKSPDPPESNPKNDAGRRRRSAEKSPAASFLPEDVIAGRNAVAEALKSGRPVNRILVAEGDKGGSVREIYRMAKEKGAVIDKVPRERIDAVAPGFRHQGVIAYVSPTDYTPMEEIVARAKKKTDSPLLVLLDELEDPRNLGAVIRTADAAGADGVIIPKRRSAPLSATVAKTSAGALEYVPVARIGNVVRAIDELKREGFWIVGADMAGTLDYFDADLTGAVVLVLGGEGRGLSRLVRENCDVLVRIPMSGKINSLNVSVAGALLMYEALRKRRGEP